MTTAKVTDPIALQGLLLAQDELLVYKDEEGDYHVLCTEPYDKNKKYTTIYLTYKDLPK